MPGIPFTDSIDQEIGNIGVVTSGATAELTSSQTSVALQVQQQTNVSQVLQQQINNTVDLAAGAFDGITSQIQDAIDASTQDAANIAKDTAAQITDAIGNTTGAVLKGANALFGGLIDWLKTGIQSILSNIGSIVSKVIDTIGPIISQIKDAVVNAFESIVPILDRITQEIQRVNDTIVQPITTTILQTIQTVGTLTAVIEKDLHDGISGILQIPTDIANAFASLDATFQRAVQQMSDANSAVVKTVWTPLIQDQVGNHLSNLATAFSQKLSSDGKPTTFSAGVKLNEPNLAAVNKQVIEQMIAGGTEILSAIFTAGKTQFDELKGGLSGLEWLGGNLFELTTWIILILSTTVAEFDPLIEFLADEAKKRLPLAKLEQGDALQAWLRGFISSDNLAEELGVRGYDATRIQVLKDLTVFLFDTNSAIDQYFRNLITEDDLRANLKDHGLTLEDQNVLIDASRRIVSVDNAVRAWRYDLISTDQLTSVLQVNRYTSAEIDITLQTLQRQESLGELIERHKRDTLFSNHLTEDPIFAQVPGDALIAAKRDGIHPQVALDIWQQQFQVPGLQHWLTLYFRGIRTRTEFLAACDYFRVPAEWRDDYIQAARPLIPFRTIPAMLKSGVITEGYAKQQIQAHGFDLAATNALIDYANQKAVTATAVNAQKIHGESVAVATELFKDGAITADQFAEVLKEHGFTDQAIAAEVQLATIKAQAQHRRDTANEIVGEALAGLIDYETAVNRFAQAGFSVGETNKYLRTLRNQLKAQSKLPSESELHAMAKAKVIEVSEYTSTLQLLGYSQKWADAFTQLRFAPANG